MKQALTGVETKVPQAEPAPEVGNESPAAPAEEEMSGGDSQPRPGVLEPPMNYLRSLKGLVRAYIDLIYAVFVALVGLLALAGLVLWFVVASDKDPALLFILSQVSAILGGLVFVGALVQASMGRRALLKHLFWIARLAIVAAVGFAGGGAVLPVGQALKTEDPLFVPLTVLLVISFYLAAISLSVAVGILVWVMPKLTSSPYALK